MSNQKQKLAEMVLQKMKQKKQAEQRNRPHHQVLQLGIQFSLEENEVFKRQISQLNQVLKSQAQSLKELKQNLQELQNTGKKKYPVIIIKPEFIASQNVPISFKQFYRKASNTYLKADLIKVRDHELYRQKQRQINQQIDLIANLQIIKIQREIKNTKILQEKRVKVLKEDLRRRNFIDQQQHIQTQLQNLQNQNKSLLRQYQIKKQNLQNRMNYSENLVIRIKDQKRRIQQKYNPISYRQYLKKVFHVRIKNQHMEKNLVQVITKLNQMKKVSEKYKIDLQKKASISFIGKTSSSPSKIKGKTQKYLEKQRENRVRSNPKNLTDIINTKSKRQQSESRSKRNVTVSNQETQGSNHVRTLVRRKGSSTGRGYSSMKTLKQTFQSSLKSQRTLSTTFAFSSAKKQTIEF